MSTIGSILNIARGALQSHQLAVRVASHNISNAQTEGYSRQRVRMADAGPDVTPVGRLGTGVRIHDISRVRDSLLDVSFRREAGRSAGFEARQEVLSRIEDVLGEPSDTGLAAALDAFHSAWADLANRPSSDTARELVVRRADEVASTMAGFSQRLDELAHTSRARLTDSVEELNLLSDRIAGLNTVIVREEAGGQTASELRDQRDRLLDRMSELGSLRVIEREKGQVAVMIENVMVVDGGDWKALEARGEPPAVTAGSVTLSLAPEGSRMGELVAALHEHIPGVQAGLDELAAALVAQTNGIHRAGYTSDGAPAGDFFDPAFTTAREMRVLVTAQDVAVSESADAPDDNRIALAMAAMRGKPADNELALGYWTAGEEQLLGGRATGGFFQGIVTRLASGTRMAEDSAAVFQTLSSQLEMRRQSVSGVSTDEELIRVMEHQQAYTAAARLVTVVDEMLQTVLDMKR